MEKKTIGKFISALRRANGMTQKELGEKLFVSDKTVSRWERDECTPELSLIPVIAEIFGITTDELLRGERNNPDKAVSDTEEVAAKQKAKSDKQFRVMLYNRLKKYKYLTLISIGISILGLIATMIVYFAFSSMLVGIGVATASIVASEICQLCFAANARLMLDEDDDSYHAQIGEVNTKVAKTAIKVTVFNLMLWTFCLLFDPVTYFVASSGLTFGVWLPIGLPMPLMVLVVCYLVYVLFVRLPFAKKGILVFTDEQTVAARKERNLLAKLLLICGAVTLAVIVFVNMFDPLPLAKSHEFDDPYEFKTFIEDEMNEWFYENFDCSLEEAVADESSYFSTEIEVCRTKDADGNTVEIYYNWYILSQLDAKRTVEDESGGLVEIELPVKVVLYDDYRDAQLTINGIAQLIVLVDLVVCVVIYIVGRRKIYRAQ